MTRRLRALAADRTGTALVEFAILMPVMLLLFLGGYQLSDASACRRRVTIVTRAVADMTAQSATLSEADVASILAASTQIMAPYSTANAQVRVTEIKTDGVGNADVIWSRSLPSGNVLSGKFKLLPKAMAAANSYYIYSETTYAYVPVMSKLLPDISFTQAIFMLPRRSNSVDMTP